MTAPFVHASNGIPLRWKTLACFWLGLLSSAVIPAAGANLIVDGGFESPVVVGGSGAVPTPWTFPGATGSGGGAIIHPPISALYPSAQEGLQYERLFSGGVIAQAFHATAGDYQLTWYDNALTGAFTRYNVYVMTGPIPSITQVNAHFVPPIVATAAFEHFQGNAVWNARSLSMTLATDDYFLLFSNGNSSNASHHGDRPFGAATAFADDFGDYLLDGVSLDFAPGAPVAMPDTALTLEDTSVTIPVLANDTDVNGDPLTMTGFTQGANGSVALNPDGTLNYTPSPNFSGVDSFSYTVSDGALTSIGTVLVTVTPVNDPPSAVGDAVTINEDTAVTLNVLANDTDVDGDVLTVHALTEAAHGSVLLNPDGSVTYRSVPNFYGEDAFTYTVADGHGGTATTIVSVTVSPVNDPPLAASNEATTLEDTSVNIPVIANDVDPDGDTLTLAGYTQAANGTVTSNPDGTLNYTPGLNFYGNDSFTYTVSDGVLASVGTVSVSVTPVNDAPLGNGDSATTAEETAVTLNVLANDSDVEGDPLAVASIIQAAHGTVTVNPDNSVTYQPELNFNGSDAFTYTVSDGNGGAATATVNVTVSPVNDPPVANDGSATGPEDSPIEIMLAATDVDGDALTFFIVTPPLHGTLNAVGGNRVIYTPAPNYSGSDGFIFRASDGHASADGVVRIAVGPVNDPPSLGPVADQTVSEGSTLSFQLTATDADGDTRMFGSPNLPSGATLSATTGEFNWTPNYSQAGTYSVTFTVTDPSGASDSQAITITVLDVPQNTNRDPDCSHAVPSVSEIWPPNHKQTVAIDILGVTDPDGDPVSVTITKILQDEPTNTLGDGSTWVDGGGIGTSRAWVRAERSGTPRVPGNGRVYEIFFTVSDGKGGTCSNSVKSACRTIKATAQPLMTVFVTIRPCQGAHEWIRLDWRRRSPRAEEIPSPPFAALSTATQSFNYAATASCFTIQASWKTCIPPLM